jgi:hypothetical protein
VVHRGATVRSDRSDFSFDDPDGLLTWLGPDRAIVSFADREDVVARRPAVVSLVGRWVRARPVRPAPRRVAAGFRRP